MTAASDESDQQIVNDVLPEQTDDLAVPPELDKLKPWHKPRKQFVRDYQWIHFSRRMLIDVKEEPEFQNTESGVPEVRYLTLPGIDYLDVRLLAELCGELDCRLTSTGFLAGDQTFESIAQANFREDSLIKAQYITDRSYTFNKQIEEVASQKSQAYRELFGRGPFHIVNIDACGSIAAPSKHEAHRLIAAIHSILEYQFLNKAGRWLLFVTTDARHDSIASDTLNNLLQTIVTNAEENNEFRIETLSLLDPNGTDLETVLNVASQNSGEKFLKLFSLGFAKWLIHLARNQSKIVRTHTTYCYSTSAYGKSIPTMACLAFEFRQPPALVDNHKVVDRPPASDNSLDTSIRAVNKVADMVNLDCRMKSCNTLRTEMTARIRNLLEEIGYSPSALDQLEED